MIAHRTSSGGRGSVLLIGVLTACGGAEPRTSAPPSSEMTSEGEAATGAPPAGEDHVHTCGQNVEREKPVANGTLGEGPRVVRLINNSGSEIQARLLDAQLTPVVEGTLRVPQGTVGEFRVREGVYYVRYRHRKSCEVRRGKPLELTGPRAGVEISIHPQFDDAGKSKMQRVQEPL